MIRLGLRLAFSGSRWGLVPTVLTAVAVAFGTAILLFALSFQPALDARYDRGAWRATPGPRSPGEQPPGTTLVSLTNGFVEGRPLTRVDVAAHGTGGPVPPGLPRVPGAGETFVSPALAELITDRPADELGERFGTIVGTVGEAGLQAPNELLAVSGQPVPVLQAAGSRAIDSFALDGASPTLDWIVSVIVVVALIGAIAPVAVFVASSTRLAAARRERRLVALRLCGATPGQVALLASVDALLVTVPGALLGVVVFVALRPFVALFELARLGWFPDAIAPPLVPAVMLVAAVPLVGVVAAIVALRRMSISPLGVARRVATGPPGRWRVLPVVLAFGAFVGSLLLGATDASDLALFGVATSFFGIVVGIVIVGPLLTAAVGRALARWGGPVRLLAGRHLGDEPRASFTAVAGVVMAVFVASAFFGFVAFTSQVSGATRVPLGATSVYVEVPPAGGPAVDDAVAVARDIGGVGTVAVVREAVLVDPSRPDAGGPLAWIVPCDELLAGSAIPGASCGDADIHVVADALRVPAGAFVVGHAVDADQEALGGPMTVELEVEAGATVDRLLPVGGREEAGPLPDLVIDPAAIEGDALALRPQFLLAATTGDRQTIERVRTRLEVALPTSGPATGAEVAAATTEIVDELGRVIGLGVAMTMAVAGAALAVAVAGSLLDRRRPFALLRLSGVTLRHLRAVLLLEAAAPLVTVSIISAVLGVVVSQVLLGLAGNLRVDAALPDASLAVLLGAGVAGALAIVSGALPLVGPVTDLEETRFE